MPTAPTLTATELRKLADVILGYFSGDAAYWRPQFITSSTSGPLSVTFAFREPQPEYASATTPYPLPRSHSAVVGDLLYRHE